jgi:hypothetical protein
VKPFIHAKNSARKYGGRPEDYQELHDFFDQSKAHVPDIRHRALLHSSFGIFLLERVFGTTITNSDGKQVSVRDVGEDHVMEDMGFIPTVDKWLGNMTMQSWMFGSRRGKVTRHIKMDD